MCVSHTLASEAPAADVIERIWSVAQQIRSGNARLSVFPDAAEADVIERPVARAVLLHLSSANLAISGGVADAECLANDAIAAWHDVAATNLAQAPAMAVRSHAFHMRLASRHGDFFRRVEHNALSQWVDAARLKSCFLRARLQFDRDPAQALDAVLALADQWRATLSPRLGGLGEIEARAAAWAEELGHTDAAVLLKDRAAAMTGRNAPWAADGPEAWPKPRTHEGLLRFGMAATVIDWPTASH